MCIAIVIPQGVVLDKETIQTCAMYNRDGGGLAYVYNGKVHISKGWMNAEEFIKAYYPIAERFGGDSPILAHFRIATQGVVNKNNCHPFKVKGGALIHNGSFWNCGRNVPTSDTSEFASIFHNTFEKNHVLEAKKDIELEIGSWNKVAVLYEDKSVVILNEDGWDTREDGIKFSHKGHRPRNFARVTH